MSQTDASHSFAPHRARWLLQFGLGAVLLMATVATLFAQREHVVFVLDDLLFIVGDPNMHAKQISIDAIARLLHGVHPEAAFRPLPLISFMIDWWRGDGDPAVFFRTNVLLHGANAILVFVLCRKIFVASGVPGASSAALIAFVAALLWAVHPIHMNAVAYAWQRMTELAAMGVLAALIFYLYGRTAGSTRARTLLFGASLICWLVGCASKENAWIAPAFLVLFEIGVLRNQTSSMFANAVEKRTLTTLLLLAAMLGGSILFGAGPAAEWINRGYQGWDFDLTQRLLTQPRVIFFHLTQLIWPAPGRFAIEHDIDISEGLFQPPTTILALGFIVLWLGVAIALLSTVGKRLYGALLFFPLVALSVESSIIPIDMIFEHRMYLPSVTLFALGALALSVLPRRIFSPATAVLTAVLVLCHTAYLKHWNSRLEIYQSAAAHAATSIRIQYNYANALSSNGQNDQAVLHYQQALAARSPSVNRLGAVEFGSIHFNQALSLLELQRRAEAKLALEKTLRLKPDHLKAHAFLAEIYEAEGNQPQARSHLEQVLRLDPANRHARNRLQQSEAARAP